MPFVNLGCYSLTAHSLSRIGAINEHVSPLYHRLLAYLGHAQRLLVGRVEALAGGGRGAGVRLADGLQQQVSVAQQRAVHQHPRDVGRCSPWSC